MTLDYPNCNRKISNQYENVHTSHKTLIVNLCILSFIMHTVSLYIVAY